MGYRVGMGVGHKELKGLKATQPQIFRNDWFFFPPFKIAGTCKWPGPSHSCHTAGPSKGATKEGNGFRQANGTPKKLGSGCTHNPYPTYTPSSQLLGTDSGSLRDARIISYRTLISTRGENRESAAPKGQKDTHTDKYAFWSTHMEACHAHAQSPHTVLQRFSVKSKK